jgi:hypothetical protein
MTKAAIVTVAACLLFMGCSSLPPKMLSKIAPVKASNPDPPDGARAVSPDTKLRWTGEPGVYYRIHFGKKSPPPLVSKQSATVFEPGPLDWDQTYYWKVDIVGGAEGDIWRFTTFWYGDPNGEEMDI